MADCFVSCKTFILKKLQQDFDQQFVEWYEPLPPPAISHDKNMHTRWSQAYNYIFVEERSRQLFHNASWELTLTQLTLPLPNNLVTLWGATIKGENPLTTAPELL